MTSKQQAPIVVGVINVATVPVDLSTGRTLAPGEQARLVLTGHELGLIDTGVLRTTREAD